MIREEFKAGTLRLVTPDEEAEIIKNASLIHKVRIVIAPGYDPKSIPLILENDLKIVTPITRESVNAFTCEMTGGQVATFRAEFSAHLLEFV
jgi:hypothetical protein